MNWNDVLKQYSSRALSAMCAALRVEEYAGRVTLSNRQRAIDQLRRVLGKPETVRRALQKVGPVEIAALKALMRTDGRAEAAHVRNAVERETPVRQPGKQPQATPDYQGTPSFEDAMARALCYGLIFSRDNKEIDFAPGRYLFIPEPVLAILRTEAVWKEALARAGQHEVERVAVEAPDLVLGVSASDFQRDLSRYLRHVRRQGDVSLTTQGWIYKTNFKTFLAALNAPADAPGDEASNARLWFMRRLLTAMGEVGYTDAGVRAHPAGPLLTMPLAQRIKLSFETWCDTGAWNEVNRVVTEHQGYDYRRDAPPELTRSRAVILRMIARVVTSSVAAPASTSARAGTGGSAGDWLSRWMSTAQLVEQVKRNEYGFLFPRKQRYRDLSGATGYYNTPYYSTNNPYNMTFPSVRDEQMGWDLVERPFITNVLTGPLQWMGLVELGYRKGVAAGEGHEPATFRLTAAGAWLLGLADEPAFIESGGRVLVQPNFTIIAMEPVSDSVLVALDEFAESQGGDRAITYHLTRQSVYRAQRLGWDAQRIGTFLEQHQGGAIPANVQRSLQEWQLLHQRITFRRSAVVLQYADDAAREGVREALGASNVSLQALAPAFDRVGPPDAGTNLPPTAELVDALSQAGWMPLVTPDEGDVSHTESSVHVDEAGEVTFKQAVPSIFTLNQLQPFVERANEHTRITGPSVRAAMSKGMLLDELLATLAHLNDGPLPARAETAIRAWAGFYGEAALRAVHVLELSSVEVLNNLLHDEQVGQFLQPIEGSAKPLALIDAENVERVRGVLIERGVTVRA